jgi:hypothetical protein
MCFCASLGADVYVRDTALTHALGYTAISVLVLYFCGAVCNNGRSAKKARGFTAVPTSESGASGQPESEPRCACIRNAPGITWTFVVVCVITVPLLTAVLVLRPCASY